jgi:hypothetical protein
MSHQGDGSHSPAIVRVGIKGGVSESVAETKLNNIADPVVTVSGLEVGVVVGTLLDDSETFVADPDDDKYILVTLVVDDTSKDVELVSYEKTTGDYGDVPTGKTHAVYLKEYLLEAAGSSLEEVESWL